MLSEFRKYGRLVSKAAMGEHSWWRSLMALYAPIAALIIWALSSIIITPKDTTEAAVAFVLIWAACSLFVLLVAAPFRVWQEDQKAISEKDAEIGRLRNKDAQVAGERMTLVDFAKLARDQFGWKFGGDNAEEIDLRAALEQAHSDGDLVLEGLYGGITIYDALPRRFFSDGAHIEWAIGFPEVNNQHVVAWSAATAGTSKRELWSDLHLGDKRAALDWLRTPKADQYRGRTREAHFRDRRHWLGDFIRVGENLEAAARSGAIKGWAAKDVVGWEAEDVLGFLERRLWPSHVERFVAAGRPLTAEDAAGGDAVADLVHAKVAVLKDFLKEYST